MAKRNEKEIAIEKLRQDTYKNINKAIDVAKQCGIAEILIAVMDYHFRRIRTFENKVEMPSVYNVEAFINMDSIKYVIQMIIKFGKVNHLDKNDFTGSNLLQAQKRYIDLRTRADEISSQNELFGLLELSPDVKLVNEKLIRSDLTDVNEEMMKLHEYGARADYLNNIKKENILKSDDYFKLFMEETEPYKDLYRDVLFAKTEEVVETYKVLFENVTHKIDDVSKRFKQDKDGLVYPYNIENMVRLLPCFCDGYVDVLKKYQETAGFFIFNHILNKEDIDVYNLKFYQLSRKPFINIAGVMIISPELILESMFIDSHYSLLETPYAEEYKKTTSDLFLTKITNIAGKYGFEEIRRDYDLYDGKRKIGDLDLILKKDDFYLIIEAKNHNLPLEVYFHDLQVTKKHLEQLKSGWIKHVTERLNHVKEHHNEINIGCNFNYIVVSKFPEPISHFSDISCFAIEEFKKWLEYGDYQMSFSDFYKRYYENDKIAPTLKEMEEVQKRLNPKIWFDNK